MSSVISVDKRTQLIVSGFIRINCPIYIPLVIIKLISLFKKLHDKFSYIEGECKFDQDRTTITTYESNVLVKGKITFNAASINNNQRFMWQFLIKKAPARNDNCFEIGLTPDNYGGTIDLYQGSTKWRQGDMIEMKLTGGRLCWKVNRKSYHGSWNLQVFTRGGKFEPRFRLYMIIPPHYQLQITDSTFID